MNTEPNRCNLNLETFATQVARELAKQLRFDMAPEALHTASDVATLLRCSPTYVSDVVAMQPGFPTPIRLLGGRRRGTKRWKRREIAAWINRQAQIERGRRGRTL